MIGVDGRQYGPVTDEQVREWVTQGRANAQTLARTEESTDWKSLAHFVEFAPTLATAQAPPVIASVDLRKSKLVAGLLGILLGGLGVHRFYLGYVAIGIAQILVTLVTFGIIGWLWGMIEGILILTNSTITTDAEGRPLKEQ
jgi:TM2 domain-containing membrane protein YozV